MAAADFVIVGSGGAGGTISWVLAKAGFKVVLLEQGPDWAKPLDDDHLQFNPVTHDEYRYRLERPDPKRRLRGEYNTFRKPDEPEAKPFDGGWTGSVLGGGSIIWGTWSFRALPIDFRLRTHFKATGQLETLEKQWGYSIPDWPISYEDMEPYYNVAESLLAVSGDRKALNRSTTQSPWFKALADKDYFLKAGNWEPSCDFPCPPYPINPVGHFIYEGMRGAGLNPFPLPTGIVSPSLKTYSTRKGIQEAIKQWGKGPKPSFWRQPPAKLWSDRVRDACNMCGFCGEFLCWGSRGPKSSTWASTIKELRDLGEHAEIRTNAKVFEVVYDERLRRATGVRYLDISDPDNPRVEVQEARHVIVACGAVQSARLLLMSGPPGGLGNRYDQVGRYATFHLFGFGATCFLPKKFQGYLHGEFGLTGNTSSFSHYFVQDPQDKKWWKAGHLTSTTKKNPLENATGLVGKELVPGKKLIQKDLLQRMELYTRTLELRLTGDDLPMARNRVDLDPAYVDEYGFPVARITRDFGEAEKKMFQLMKPVLQKVFEAYKKAGLLTDADVQVPDTAILKLIGDHQMGTCRMGEDPTQSVLDPFCRLHEAPNVFVVDSSFMPTGLGLNPMVTVMANALRVGTWIVEEAKRGKELG